ncbi:MAG: hypothetical protein FD121_725 [Gallionellaceae bacterium]|nr:MAG: hypothetical protein FD121_725 [Gallionellaceae bacterium]
MQVILMEKVVNLGQLGDGQPRSVGRCCQS